MNFREWSIGQVDSFQYLLIAWAGDHYLNQVGRSLGGLLSSSVTRKQNETVMVLLHSMSKNIRWELTGIL